MRSSSAFAISAARALADDNSDYARSRIMLGLRQQFEGDRARRARDVRNDEKLTRAGRCIDGYYAGDLKFRFGNVRVSRPDNTIDARHCFRPVRHRRNRARAADREYAVDSLPTLRRPARSGTERRLRARRAENNLADASDACRNRAHQHAARVCGASAGCVDADAS
jgi:hypothetical protein